MPLVGFKNTHNQDVYLNPAQILYVTTFEEHVTIVALAITSAGGKPFCLYLRGSVEAIRQKLENRGAREGQPPQGQPLQVVDGK